MAYLSNTNHTSYKYMKEGKVLAVVSCKLHPIRSCQCTTKIVINLKGLQETHEHFMNEYILVLYGRRWSKDAINYWYYRTSSVWNVHAL